MAELSTIINNNLFRSATDGLSGNFYVKVEDGSIVYEQEPTEPSVGYGELVVLGGTLALTGVDITNAANYVTLNATNMWSAGLSKHATLDTANGTITIIHGGVYDLSSFLVSSTSTVDTTVAIRYDVNGTVSTRYLSARHKAAGDTHTLAGHALVQLNDGDVIKLMVASDTTTTLTAINGGLTLHKVES